MQKKISAALISVFYKDGLAPLAQTLHQAGVVIYSTGGTREFLEKNEIPCIGVESITGYPSILGGRVKTLHPVIFGGILGRRAEKQDLHEMSEHHIPEIDLVIVDLYPFSETVRQTTDEKLIIEKIDIGGPSMIRAAAKNFADVVVIASKTDYSTLETILSAQNGHTSLEQRRDFAAKAFEIVQQYDTDISRYFHSRTPLRYGENPHQQAFFHGSAEKFFTQLHGKELSYNNLVDVDAALHIIAEFTAGTKNEEVAFAIIKHTNVCGIALRNNAEESWKAALAGDAESAFGGVLVCNADIDEATATQIDEIFFEVLMAPGFSEEALAVLFRKKNRIILKMNAYPLPHVQSRSILDGELVQDTDEVNYSKWEEVGGRETSGLEKKDLVFANIVCKHLKSNAIALVKNCQLIGKGCGQTSRIDALRQAIGKAEQFHFSLNGAVLASDAFFPFSDCAEMAHAAGIEAFIQPGGSVRDKDSIAYCIEHKLAMVMTGSRHFRH